MIYTAIGSYLTPTPYAPPRVRVVSTFTTPVMPIETLRSQCEVVPIDGDSNGELHPHDDQLRGYLEAAVEAAEDFTGLSIALRTYEMALDEFPVSSTTLARGIEIPRPPLIRIDHFLADAGSDGEFDEGDNYILDDFSYPARLMPVSGWPSMDRASNGIRVRFTAGYLPVDGSESELSTSDYSGAQPLPAVIKQALLLLVGHFYANREDSIDKALATIPHGFHDLLRPRRILLGMA